MKLALVLTPRLLALWTPLYNSTEPYLFAAARWKAADLAHVAECGAFGATVRPMACLNKQPPREMTRNWGILAAKYRNSYAASAPPVEQRIWRFARLQCNP